MGFLIHIVEETKYIHMEYTLKAGARGLMSFLFMYTKTNDKINKKAITLFFLSLYTT